MSRLSPARVALALAPATLWAAFLLWLGSQPIVGPRTDLPLDKLAHLGLYGTLGLLVGWGARRVGARRGLAATLLVLALAAGVADELDQRRVPERTADPLDWCADAIGVCAGFLLARRRRPDVLESN